MQVHMCAFGGKFVSGVLQVFLALSLFLSQHRRVRAHTCKSGTYLMYFREKKNLLTKKKKIVDQKSFFLTCVMELCIHVAHISLTQGT